VTGGGILVPKISSLNCSVYAPFAFVSPATLNLASFIASIMEACLIGFVRTGKAEKGKLVGVTLLEQVKVHSLRSAPASKY
jgi:hypothetical protein